MRLFKKITFCVMILILSGGSAGAAQLTLPGKELGFVPHKALYQVKLQNADAGSQIINISGQMYYEWSYDCNAWTSKHRFNVLYEYADSPAMRITSDFSNFESFDGTTLDFNAIRKQNGQQYEEIRGHADIFKDKAGDAAYTQPDGLAQELPIGTLYPMAHTIKVIEAMNAGKKFYNATIFDGSDDKGPVEVNAFIGKPVDGLATLKAVADNPALDKELLKGTAHNIQLAFFPHAETQENADYEMSLTLHDNSIISDMVIDYNDFSIRQQLIALEAIDTSKVEKTCQ